MSQVINQHVKDNIHVFKQTYQKGSRIYRYLSDRWKTHPLFLQRTLSYVNKHHDQRLRRRPTKISSVVDRLRASPRKCNSSKASRQSGQDKQVAKRTWNNGSKGTVMRVVFDWICDDEARTHQITKSYSFYCPWCEVDFLHLDTLMMHLKCCHARYNFVLSGDGDLPLISMSANHSFDGSYCGFKYPGHDLKRDFRFTPESPQRRIPQTQIIHFRTRRRAGSNVTLNNNSCNGYFAPNEEDDIDVDVCSGRLYYHTSTCLPVKPNEGDIDSEADIDPEWLRERTQLMIDEFTDVNEGEKEILKLWNLHIMSNYRHKSDNMIRQACLDFVEKEANTIFTRNLTKNLTLHLVNLHDFGLISSGDVRECIRKMRQLRPPPSFITTKATGKVKLERCSNEHCQHSPPAKRALLNSHCNQ